LERQNLRGLISAQISEIARRNTGFSLAVRCGLSQLKMDRADYHLGPFGRGRDEVNPALDQGFVLDDVANASFITAESFDQPQASELPSQRVDFDRSAGCFTTGDDWFLGVNTNGGPTG
jgi:hypothetical protein